MDIPIPTREEGISVPLSSSSNYAQAAVSHILHLHVPDIHNHHLIPSTAPPIQPDSNNNSNVGGASGPGPIINDRGGQDHHDSEDSPHHHVVNRMGAASTFKKVGVVVKYRECLKNHAAAMGGNATDGCGEFMPSGEEGTMEALTCSACNCHRNFHRKEGEGDHHLQACDWAAYGHSPQHLNRLGRKVILGGGGGGTQHKNMLPHEALVYPTGALIASRAPIPHQMIMPYNMSGGSESDEHEDGLMVRPPASAVSHLPMVKKRFRTKFTQEQKEKMLHFAEKVGWKIQRQEESVVQHFCQEIGVKRRVLKVWMHNNKHNLANKNLNNNIEMNP